jgi:hypothetical protein
VDQSTVPTTTTRVRTIRALCGLYLAATVATLGFLAWKRDDSALVTTDAWVHEVVLLAFAVVLVRVAKRAAAGNARAYLRLRIISVVVPVVAIVEAIVPGFPGWMRVEQVGYGLVLLAVTALANTRGAREAFARS